MHLWLFRFASFFVSGLATGYLNRPEVMAAIHVRDPGFCWAVCNTAPGWKYTVSPLPYFFFFVCLAQ